MANDLHRSHLVWDWNGTLLDDLSLVISAANVAFAAVSGPEITADQHRRQFRRPIADYYGEVLGRVVDAEEFARLDSIFHEAYRLGLVNVGLAADAQQAMSSWSGSQSLLSMWFHDELVPAIDVFGLTGLLARVDGLRSPVGGDRKAEHLATHIDAIGVPGEQVVLIGDSVDDADAAASVGAACVLYTGGFTDAERLREVGVPVVDSLVKAVEVAASC